VSTRSRNLSGGLIEGSEMSALGSAEERAKAAIGRLEAALRGIGGDGDPAGAALERATLERDCELLRAECDTLRRRLAGIDERDARLAAIVGQVEGRLDGAITRLDELAEG
jgi:uncharacterized membrane protein YccC